MKYRPPTRVLKVMAEALIEFVYFECNHSHGHYRAGYTRKTRFNLTHDQLKAERKRNRLARKGSR